MMESGVPSGRNATPKVQQSAVVIGVVVLARGSILYRPSWLVVTYKSFPGPRASPFNETALLVAPEKGFVPGVMEPTELTHMPANGSNFSSSLQLKTPLGQRKLLATYR